MRGWMIDKRGTAQRLLRKVAARSSQTFRMNSAPVQRLALEAETEVAGLVGVLGGDTGLPDHGLESLEVRHHLADMGEIGAHEWLRVQELPREPPLDAERGAPVRRQRKPRAALDGPGENFLSLFVDKRKDSVVRDLGVVVADRRIDLPGVVDEVRELCLDAFDLGGRQIDVAELEYVQLRILDLDCEVVPLHEIGRDV